MKKPRKPRKKNLRKHPWETTALYDDIRGHRDLSKAKNIAQSIGMPEHEEALRKLIVTLADDYVANKAIEVWHLTTEYLRGTGLDEEFRMQEDWGHDGVTVLPIEFKTLLSPRPGHVALRELFDALGFWWEDESGSKLKWRMDFHFADGEHETKDARTELFVRVATAIDDRVTARDCANAWDHVRKRNQRWNRAKRPNPPVPPKKK
jgi:hypothetical protein